MIPKIIHYVWIGKEIPEEYQAFIKRWKELMPDYEFRHWSDLGEFPKDKWNLDIKDVKPGFASDFIRLKALYYYGGIYLDSDVEVFKRFDDLLHFKSFIGYHYDSLLGTAVIGSEPGNPIIRDMLDIIFANFERNKKPTVSNYWVTEYYIRHFDSFTLAGKNQILDDGNAVFAKCFFEQMAWRKNRGGYSFHHCGGSWYNAETKGVKKLVRRILGIRLTRLLSEKMHQKKNPFWGYYKMQKRGIKPQNIEFGYLPNLK